MGWKLDTCFIIQPFDQGEFDKRCDDIFIPAVEAANLQPYRIDRDPGVEIPIEDIEKGIANSRVCLADITLDNPNVWLEVGMAIMCKKDVILVCAEERKKFPFDVQHRKIIIYKKESLSDFSQLGEKITSRIKALLKKNIVINELPNNPIVKVHGLSQHELVALVSIMENMDFPNDYVYANAIHTDMERAGFTKIAANIAMTKLLKNGYIKLDSRQDEYGNITHPYSLTDKGQIWLLENEDKLVLRHEYMNEIPF